MYLTVQQQDGPGIVLYTYRIYQEESSLISVEISSGTDRALLDYLKPDLNFATAILLAPSVPVKKSRLSAMVTLIHGSENSELQSRRCWLFFDGDQQPVRMVRAIFGHQPQPEDLDLAFVTAGDEPGYYFFSPRAQSLYFQADDGLSGREQITQVMSNVRTVFAQGAKQLACTREGVLWLMKTEGAAMLVGVTAEWIRKHRQALRVQLEKLVRYSADKASFLLLQGMKNSDGQAVPAWYDSLSNRIIMGGTGADTHNLVYLGSSPDGQKAWIFATDSGQLYCQAVSASLPVIDENLIMSGQVRDAERWSLPGRQKISTAVRQGNRLLLKTSDGAVLLLPMTAGPADKPALIAFHSEKAQDTDIIATLNELTAVYDLPAAIRLTTVSGQAPSWYLTQEKIILRAHRLDSAHSFNFLGNAAGTRHSYIHDMDTGALWLVSDSESVLTGHYACALLKQQTLILQVSEAAVTTGRKIQLPRLMGADSIIITGSTSQQRGWLLSPEVLTHYRQIVINDKGENSLIRIAPAGEDTVTLQRSGEDLMLYSARSDTSILLTYADKSAERGMRLAIADMPPVTLQHLLVMGISRIRYGVQHPTKPGSDGTMLLGEMMNIVVADTAMTVPDVAVVGQNLKKRGHHLPLPAAEPVIT